MASDVEQDTPPDDCPLGPPVDAEPRIDPAVDVRIRNAVVVAKLAVADMAQCVPLTPGLEPEAVDIVVAIEMAPAGIIGPSRLETPGFMTDVQYLVSYRITPGELWIEFLEGEVKRDYGTPPDVGSGLQGSFVAEEVERSEFVIVTPESP
jgi:hypothetical protein